VTDKAELSLWRFTVISTWYETHMEVYAKKLNPSHYKSWRRLGGGGGRKYSLYSFSTSALDEGEWLASRPGRALAPGSHFTGGWVGLKAGLDTEVRGKIFSPLPGIEPRSSGSPTRNQTLYWLSYPAHWKCAPLGNVYKCSVTNQTIIAAKYWNIIMPNNKHLLLRQICHFKKEVVSRCI
jgi:hypothetical protein